jgi:hypothetical protein
VRLSDVSGQDLVMYERTYAPLCALMRVDSSNQISTYKRACGHLAGQPPDRLIRKSTAKVVFLLRSSSWDGAMVMNPPSKLREIVNQLTGMS